MRKIDLRYHRSAKAAENDFSAAFLQQKNNGYPSEDG